VTLPSSEASGPIAVGEPGPSNPELNQDCWYHFEPDQHVSNLPMQWEDPLHPIYADYLKAEMQMGNSMGPGEPVYTDRLEAQPFHAAEP